MALNNSAVGKKNRATIPFLACENAIKLKRATSKMFRNKNKRQQNLIKITEFNGNESVKHSRVRNEDFILPLQDHVANYDPEILTKDWNDNKTSQHLRNKIYKAFMYGVPRRTSPIILVYLLLFYTFSIVLLTHVCVSDSDKKLNSATVNWLVKKVLKHVNETDSGKIVDTFCNDPNSFDVFKNAEQRFSQLLIWLLGVYVAVTARRFWRQVSSIPRMDSLCITLNGVIWLDPSKKEEKVEIIRGMTVKQFKMTIVRLFLLSWTMAFSNISPRLKRSFQDAKYYNDKRLLTRTEYYLLKGAFTGDDGWSEKWCVPLIWANKMILQVVQRPKDVDMSCIKDQYQLTCCIDKLQCDLQMILNHFCYKTSRMLYQAMTVAICFFVLLGVIGGQSDVYRTHDNSTFAQRLAANFPIYQIMKYVLVFGWIIAAKDLQNPFGDDE